MKSVCISGKNINGKREFTVDSFGLDKPPGHRIFQNMKFEHHKKRIKPQISDLTFCSGDDKNRRVGINVEKKYLYFATNNWCVH